MSEDTQLKEAFERIQGIAALTLFVGMFPGLADLAWVWEQGEVEERFGREMTEREKNVYLDERRKAFLRPEVLHEAIDHFVTNPGLRHRLHDGVEELVEQAKVDDILRQIARDMSRGS